MKNISLIISCVLLLTFVAARGQDTLPPHSATQDTHASHRAAAFYTRHGADATFSELMEQEAIPVGRNSKQGVMGSTIKVNHELLADCATADNPIPQAIRIHTLGNSFIPRRDFHKWTRWYQEDGNTQVFRLFEGEHNVRNQRANAARIEAFSAMKWTRGAWHEWEGTYTLIRPQGAIFQAKNIKNAWSVMIMANRDGDVKLNHRRHQEDKIIARDMIGKPFHLRVRDNGHDYEVYFNGKRVGAGHFDRPEGHNTFRWGMYVGGKTLVKYDAMLLVTGAKFRKVREDDGR